MKRFAHCYVDAATGTTLDAYFARDDSNIGNSAEAIVQRRCLAERVGVIHSKTAVIELRDLDAAPASTEEVYLRLHLLSECAVRPNAINLAGLFDLLPTVAWTSAGPVLPERVDALRTQLAKDHDHHLAITMIDKIPRMTDYVVPIGVRIGDADRVRLGAHLAPGTTVMHEGFVNFNAGTIGAAMIEGRVTPGVIVGAGSDVGAGSSIMGTLSGGGQRVNSIGERSLLGANGGVGISLGDDCVVEAGLYLTAGTKVRLETGEVMSARDLSGRNGLLFRRNSQSGAVEAVSSEGSSWRGLNPSLHASETKL